MKLPSHFHYPITVLGMHRSGTSLVARMLSASGIWMGYDLDRNHESSFFQRLDKDVFRSLDSNWARSEQALQQVQNVDILQHWVEKFTSQLDSFLLPDHFGWRGYLHMIIHPFTRPVRWGWKDPRTTLLMPLWKAVFPQLRVIAVLRDPRDVCVSLYYRERHRYDNKVKHGRTDITFDFELDKCLDLWKIYTQHMMDYIEAHPDTSVLLRYEDLHQAEHVASLIEFIGGGCRQSKLTGMVSPRQKPYTPPPGHDAFVVQLQTDPYIAAIGYNLPDVPDESE